MTLLEILNIAINNPLVVTIVIFLLSIIKIPKVELNLWGFARKYFNEPITTELTEFKRESREMDLVQMRHTIIHDGKEIINLYENKKKITDGMLQLYDEQVRLYKKDCAAWEGRDGYVLSTIREVNRISKEIRGAELFGVGFMEELEREIS